MPLVTQGGGGYTWIPSMIGFVDGQILIESETDSHHFFRLFLDISSVTPILSFHIWF